MFGVDEDEETTVFRVCCGPRCGAEPGQGGVYAAAERAAATRGGTVRPTMCQGFCGLGVTLALPDGTRVKLRDIRDARALITDWIDEREPTLCQPSRS